MTDVDVDGFLQKSKARMQRLVDAASALNEEFCWCATDEGHDAWFLIFKALMREASKEKDLIKAISAEGI